VPAHRQEARVAPDSAVETFVALKLCVDTWRWAGVPFYLRTGKRLARRATEVVVHFRRAPEFLFTQVDASPPEPNVLRMRIQPDAGIALRFGAKVAGPGMHVRAADLVFGFDAPATEAYERPLLDVVQGNPTLFMRSEEVEAAWRVVTSILAGWADEPSPASPNYRAGPWGPATADALLTRDGSGWVQP
jgi:glucose-6-phosphate 1-dehydrogenase